MAKKRKALSEWPLSRLTVDIPEELHKETGILAIREGKEIRELVARWIEQGLAAAGVKLTRRYLK